MNMFKKIPSGSRATRNLALAACALGLLSGNPLLFGKDISQALAVETNLPVYLNRDQAVLVFERKSPGEQLELSIVFSDRISGTSPAGSLSLRLDDNSLFHEQQIDISEWPDGEYLVTVTPTGGTATDGKIVRAIRKQTQVAPQAPQGPFNVKNKKLFFVDDWYIDRQRGLEVEVKPAEMIPLEIQKLDPQYDFFANSVNQFYFGNDDNFYARLSMTNRAGEPPAHRWMKTADFKEWELVEKPAPRSSRATSVNLKNESPRAKTPLRDLSNLSFRHYDPAKDGQVNLSEVVVQYSGMDEVVKWGEVTVPRRSRIALWVKPDGEALILGDPITQDKLDWEANEVGDWKDSNDNFGELRFTSDGKHLRVFQSRRVPRHEPFLVHYDNIHSERVMVTWSTEDGLNWTPTYFDAATEEDPWSTQHYGVDLWWVEDGDLELGYHRIYDVQTQRLYTDLAYSRDGLHWTRLHRGEPFLDNGERGDWNFGYAITTGNRTRMEHGDYYYEPFMGINVLHFMFLQAWEIVTKNNLQRSVITPEFLAERFGDGRLTGENGVQNSAIMSWYNSIADIAEHTREQRFTAAIMKYRKDGWAALQPVKRWGDFVTKPLVTGGEVWINAKCHDGGYVRVEVLDKAGNPLPEYSGSNAASFAGDATEGKLVWANNIALKLPNEPIRLRVSIENAELYTLQF